MQKVKAIDYLTSLVAACLWLAGGVITFLLIGLAANHVVAGYGDPSKGSPIYTLVGLLLYAGFGLGAWLAVKWLLPLFMRVTKQQNLTNTVHEYIVFSWLSIFSLLLADAIGKDNLVINFGIWALCLSIIYLFAKYKAVK